VSAGIEIVVVGWRHSCSVDVMFMFRTLHGQRHEGSNPTVVGCWRYKVRLSTRRIGVAAVSGMSMIGMAGIKTIRVLLTSW
jgi:hypothetical protein